MNRDRIRDRAKFLGLKTANFAYAENEEELILEANKIGTKVAVKPVMSSSGKGQSYANSENEFIKAMCFCIQNPEKVNEIGNEAKKYALENFSKEHITNELKKII